MSPLSVWSIPELCHRGASDALFDRRLHCHSASPCCPWETPFILNRPHQGNCARWEICVNRLQRFFCSLPVCSCRNRSVDPRGPSLVRRLGKIVLPSLRKDATSIEQVRSRIGRLDHALDGMRETCLGNFSRLARLSAPIAERRSEFVWDRSDALLPDRLPRTANTCQGLTHHHETGQALGIAAEVSENSSNGRAEFAHSDGRYSAARSAELPEAGGRASAMRRRSQARRPAANGHLRIGTVLVRHAVAPVIEFTPVATRWRAVPTH